MENLFQYLIPVFALTLLAAGWMLVQIIAKKMNIKNHIDETSGCCGACSEKKDCTNNSAAHLE
jgi:hypothetical protein